MAHILGLTAAIGAIRGQTKRYAASTLRGMKRAGLFLQRQSQLLVPVDTGNLKNSAYTRLEKREKEVEVGYTANYAVQVHENLGATHEPGKQAKFLEQPAREHASKIKVIIATEAARG